MDWTWLILLACPIMMLFMMKGMHGGKHKELDHSSIEVVELKKQNEKLAKELDEVKKQTI